MDEEEISFNSVIESGLSPQGGACFTLERKLPGGNSHYTPTCLGGVIAGKTTNAALTKEGFRIDAKSFGF